MVAHSCSPGYLAGWGRRIPCAWAFEAALSYEHATALQYNLGSRVRLYLRKGKGKGKGRRKGRGKEKEKERGKGKGKGKRKEKKKTNVQYHFTDGENWSQERLSDLLGQTYRKRQSQDFTLRAEFHKILEPSLRLQNIINIYILIGKVWPKRRKPKNCK